MLLTEDELRSATGFTQADKQHRFFCANGFKSILGGDNRCKILREHYYQKMGMGGKLKQKKQPNFSLVRKNG